MGEVLEFGGVVGVILVAALGWRWGNVWIQRLRGETAAELDELEERLARVERALESSEAAPRIAGAREDRENA